MKALVFEIGQGLASLRYSEAPGPELAAGDLLVDISATSINRADHLLLEGKAPGATPATNIPGKDFVGFVRQAPDANSPFSEGERVFGVMPVEQFGAHAGQISISPRFLARAPAGVEYGGGNTVTLYSGNSVGTLYSRKFGGQFGDTLLNQVENSKFGNSEIREIR